MRETVTRQQQVWVKRALGLQNWCLSAAASRLHSRPPAPLPLLLLLSKHGAQAQHGFLGGGSLLGVQRAAGRHQVDRCLGALLGHVGAAHVAPHRPLARDHLPQQDAEAAAGRAAASVQRGWARPAGATAAASSSKVGASLAPASPCSAHLYTSTACVQPRPPMRTSGATLQWRRGAGKQQCSARRRLQAPVRRGCTTSALPPHITCCRSKCGTMHAAAPAASSAHQAKVPTTWGRSDITVRVCGWAGSAAQRSG